MRKQNYEHQPTKSQAIKKDLAQGKTKGKTGQFSEGAGDSTERRTQRVSMEAPTPL